MANMSYVRFENTCGDLRDCIDHINDTISKREHNHRLALIRMCHEVTEVFPPGERWEDYLLHDEINPEEEE